MSDSEESKIMDSILDIIRTEQPKIDASVKNFLSVLIAKGQKDPAVARSVSSSTSSTVDSLIDLSPHFLMDYAKLFLSCVQQTEMIDYSEYFTLNLQKADESAIDRLNEMCKYKAFYAYRQHVIQSGQKVSKHFGRSYFTFANIWSRIRGQYLSRLESGENKNLTLGEGLQFIELYEKSLAIANDTNTDSDIIWAQNFQQALQKRQISRMENATQRVNEAMADAMRRAVEEAQIGSNSSLSDPIAEENEGNAEEVER